LVPEADVHFTEGLIKPVLTLAFSCLLSLLPIPIPVYVAVIKIGNTDMFSAHTHGSNLPYY
jgi:hypothetical protein